MEDNKNLKNEALKVVNSLEEVKSVVCIVSDGKHASACIGSEGRANLQNMLVNTMIKQPALRDLFKGAIMAAKILGEEK